MPKETHKFSNKHRNENKARAVQNNYDLVVIGGGITGAGILLDATLRGLKVLLIEKQDFASGTSSKSTKLIHGGLRYLKQLEFGLVKETGTERAIVHNMACHLVHPEKMVLPIVKQGTFGKFSANLAIGLYDILAKVKGDQKRKSISKAALLKKEPSLKKDMIKSGIIYSEYRTDDARLTIELIKAAKRLGAEAFNYMEVESFLYSDHKIVGVSCKDHVSNEPIAFRASIVVSASGPWVDLLRVKDNSNTETNLHLSKGVHIVLDKSSLPINNSIYFDDFDGRMIFAIPREKVVYVGTSDTTFKGHPDDQHCTKDDAQYLVDAVNNYFDIPSIKLSSILSSWSGLRPLIQQSGKKATELSRKDEIFTSESGLISIAGGKLTGFRKMAERIVDLVVDQLGKPRQASKTKNYQIHHNAFDGYNDYLDWTKKLISRHQEIDQMDVWQLVNNFGKDAELILANSKTKFDGDLILAQLEHALDFESVYHPMDFFERRSGWLYFDIKKVSVNYEKVIDQIAEYFSIDAGRKSDFIDNCLEAIEKNGLVKFKHIS